MYQNEEFLWRRTPEHHFRVEEWSPPERRTRVDFSELRDHDVVRFSTAAARYQLRVIRMKTRDALVRGGSSFEKWTLVKLCGAFEGESTDFKPRIQLGSSLALMNKQCTVVTGPVRSMEVCH